MNPIQSFFVGGLVGAIVVASAIFVIQAQDALIEPVLEAPGTVTSAPGTVAPISTPAPDPATPTPPPTLVSDRDPLRIDGIGGLTIGMTVEQAENAGGYPISVSSDFSEECRIAQMIGGPLDLSLMLSNGLVVRIDVYNRSRIRTVAGLVIGDPVSRVRDLYGAAITEEPHPYLGQRGSYLIYRPEGVAGQLMIFETDSGRVTSFRSGYEAQVRYIEGCA